MSSTSAARVEVEGRVRHAIAGPKGRSTPTRAEGLVSGALSQGKESRAAWVPGCACGRQPHRRSCEDEDSAIP